MNQPLTHYPALPSTDASQLTHKSFQTDQDVRWCPGCGDYSILKQVQKVLPTLEIPKEDFVFISGIGCSSRFPYYMNTYGMHTVHGRAPAIATGVKSLRPDLSVWMITGDGDALSIGGNHLIHMLRRNVDLKVLLFNNRIYGLTKGQYSPTSEQGKQTKSSPLGSLEEPFNPISLALSARATFVARSLDVDPKHLQETLIAAAHHKGTALVEIYQNCNIFNDGAFAQITERTVRQDRQVRMRAGEPALFGKNEEKGLVFNAQKIRFEVAEVAEVGLEAIYVHDPSNLAAAHLLAALSYPDSPTPIGVLYTHQRPTYDQQMTDQVNAARARLASSVGEEDSSKRLSVQHLLDSGDTWTVEG